MPTSVLLEKTPTLVNTTIQRSTVYLDGDIDLTLHTKLAQSLLEGNWSHGNLGLWQFALKVRELWKGHRADDPYADWYFMKLDEKIHTIREDIQALEHYCQQRLAQLRGFKIKVFENPQPIQLALKFAIPFSYMGASLLADLDYVTRQAYTLRHVGQLLEPKQLPMRIKMRLRQLFSVPLGWKIQVTRQDIRENNALAQEAKQKMGEIPTAILNRELKFVYLLDTMLGSTQTAV